MRTTSIVAALVSAGLVVTVVGALGACGGTGSKRDELLDTGLVRVPPISVRRLASGREARPRFGDVVQVHLRQQLADGTTVKDTRALGTPETFRMGRRETFAGLEHVVSTMRLGESCEAHIPWQAAFGSSGGNGVPPRTDIVCHVELVQIQSR